MVIIINGQEITCESYLKESNKLVLINAQIETEAGIETTNMELNGVNWSSVTLPINELEVARAIKLQALNIWAYTFVSAGYTDTETGYKLFCSENDVANYATLKNAIMEMSDSATVEIGTMTGWQTSTKGVVYPLLVRYSAYMLPFTTKYMKTKTMIEYAQTVEQIEAITW